MSIYVFVHMFFSFLIEELLIAAYYIILTGHCRIWA